MVLSEEELAPSILLPAIQKLYDHRSDYIAAMEKSQQGDAISTIIQLIEDAFHLLSASEQIIFVLELPADVFSCAIKLRTKNLR